MKKLLSILGTLTLVATSSATVIACGNTTEPPGPIIEDNEELIKELKLEVEEIFVKHLNDNVYQNLVGLPDTENRYSFLNRTKIVENTNLSPEEIDPYDLKLLETDIKKVLEIDKLTTDLNNLKKINKFKIILNDVNSLLKNVIFNWNSLKVLSYESNDKDELYLGNVIIDYKIEIQYKGKKDIETFTIDENFTYTSTNSNSLKKASDDFYKNIAKDYFLSSKAEDRKHTNLNWNEIKGSKKTSDGFGRIDNELQKYYETDSSQNGFRDSLIKFTKENYFDKAGNVLPLSFEGDLIYKSKKMNNFSITQAVNQWKNYDNKESIKYDYNSDSGRIILDTVFRNDPNLPITKNNLSAHYFKTSNLEIWKQNFEPNKEIFLEEHLKIDKDDKIKQTDEYKSSMSLGYVNLTGLSISLDNGAYIHKLPDFRLGINYFIDINLTNAQILDLMSEFTVDSLKVWHDMFGVYHGYEYPSHNSNEDFLMTLKSSEMTKAMTDIFNSLDDNDISSQVFFRDSFSLMHTYLKESKAKLFDKANLLDNSYYYMVFATLDSSSPSERKNTGFDWTANEKIGINIKWNGKNQTMNNKILTFRFGYLNFHINLDKITMGAKELGDKELVKFI
ncbi:lipoprotein [Spiroplasma cantharicola]|uniref:Lipoprotein n=1 Tax=Spiroplasma cantharicola TaxID=362837 RepID=A0A0M5KEJ6_9MOLU|nr:lipoprotein [Spiroplasma cantharicola]ALD66563.1 hypothetical protein SCANT_v1c06570 [Spiroplasma cantharicola]